MQKRRPLPAGKRRLPTDRAAGLAAGGAEEGSRRCRVPRAVRRDSSARRKWTSAESRSPSLRASSPPLRCRAKWSGPSVSARSIASRATSIAAHGGPGRRQVGQGIGFVRAASSTTDRRSGSASSSCSRARAISPLRYRSEGRQSPARQPPGRALAVGGPAAPRVARPQGEPDGVITVVARATRTAAEYTPALIAPDWRPRDAATRATSPRAIMPVPTRLAERPSSPPSQAPAPDPMSLPITATASRAMARGRTGPTVRRSAARPMATKKTGTQNASPAWTSRSRTLGATGDSARAKPAR